MILDAVILAASLYLLNDFRSQSAYLASQMASGEALGLEKRLESLGNLGCEPCPERSTAEGNSLGPIYYSLFLEGRSGWGGSSPPASPTGLFQPYQLCPRPSPHPQPGCWEGLLPEPWLAGLLSFLIPAILVVVGHTPHCGFDSRSPND